MNTARIRTQVQDDVEAQRFVPVALDWADVLATALESPNMQNAVAVSPDGTRVIFAELAPKTGNDLMQLQLDGTRRITPLVQTPFAESNGVISPDGRWLAYEANDSGRFEVYVRPFPDVDSGLWQVSTGGGRRPLWARNGQELFYVSPAGAIMRVGVERAPSWAATTPTLLIKEGYVTAPRGNPDRSYDISPDGQRLLLLKAGDGSDHWVVKGLVHRISYSRNDWEGWHGKANAVIGRVGYRFGRPDARVRVFAAAGAGRVRDRWQFPSTVRGITTEHEDGANYGVAHGAVGADVRVGRRLFVRPEFGALIGSESTSVRSSTRKATRGPRSCRYPSMPICPDDRTASSTSSVPIVTSPPRQ